MNPASEVHIRHLYIPRNCILTPPAEYMSSPTSSTIDNVIIPSSNTQNYPISCIFGQLIEPEHGQVSPDFLEYQDPGSTDDGGNQEGTSIEADGIGVEAGATHQSLPQSRSPVSVTTVSNISDMLCTHNCPTEYCHDHQHYPVFVPPLEGKYIAHNILQQAQEAHRVGVRPITGYTIDNDNSDKENNPNATEVPPNLKGKGWVRVTDNEAREKEVNEVWELQKQALSGSTTLGNCTQSGSRQAVVCPPFPTSLSSTKALGTSLCSSPTTRDAMSLPSIFQST